MRVGQDAVEHIMRVENFQRECWELLAAEGHARSVQEEGIKELITHTDVRCVETRMKFCGTKACSTLDTMCKDAFRECLPDVDSLLADRSPLEPARPPARLGSVLTLQECHRQTSGASLKLPPDVLLADRSTSKAA